VETILNTRTRRNSLEGNEMSVYIEGAEMPQPRSVEIKVAIDTETQNEIIALRKRKYRNIYPEMDLDNDILDEFGITLYTRDTHGQINSTARLGVGGPVELPEDRFLQHYREQGFRLIEWGRFIIDDGDYALLRRYYQAVYTLSKRLGFDAVVMAMKPKDISLHQRLIGVRVLEKDMGISYGGPFSLACVVWELANTKPKFFSWMNKK
jgi:hypothetical protein